MMRQAIIVGTFLSWSQLAPLSRGDEPKTTAQQLEFFEAKIRPLLAENCFQCHGDKKQKGGLRLDSRAALLKGGDDGPVVIPGQPDNSRLIMAVRHQGDLKMPPKQKLSSQAIDALTLWVKTGAP